MLIVNRRLRRQEHRARRLRRGQPARVAARSLPRSRCAAHHLTRASAARHQLGAREADRSKNFFALGLVYGCMEGPRAHPRVDAVALQSGHTRSEHQVAQGRHHFGEPPSCFRSRSSYRGQDPAGRLRNITGNTALAWGIVAAGVQMDRPVFLAPYPITTRQRRAARARSLPALRHQDVPGEDEIAAASAAIGAAYAGHLGIFQPRAARLHPEQEAIGIAVMAELPVVT